MEKKTPGAGFQEEKPAIEETELQEVVKLQSESPKYAHPKMPALHGDTSVLETTHSINTQITSTEVR